MYTVQVINKASFLLEHGFTQNLDQSVNDTEAHS